MTLLVILSGAVAVIAGTLLMMQIVKRAVFEALSGLIDKYGEDEEAKELGKTVKGTN